MIKEGKIIVIADSFKGSLSSSEVAEAVKNALSEKDAKLEVLTYDISDGGEGFAEIVTKARGGKMVEMEARDALKRPIKTRYGVADDFAVMDVASVVGLTKLTPMEQNPWAATSYGVGEMIHHILRKGIRKIIIGLGGSATNDCGRGMLEALVGQKRIYDCMLEGPYGIRKSKNELVEALHEVAGMDDCEFIIASDVNNPLCGPNGATHVFAAQKGASPAILPRLEQRNRKFGLFLEEQTGRKIIDQPGAGAAGGIGAALMTMKHWKMQRGIDILIDLYDLRPIMKSASLIITGEGCIDRQTLCGKAPYSIGLMAKEMGVPCIALCGRINDNFDTKEVPWTKIIQVSPPDQSLSESMRPDVARENIRKAISSASL